MGSMEAIDDARRRRPTSGNPNGGERLNVRGVRGVLLGLI